MTRLKKLFSLRFEIKRNTPTYINRCGIVKIAPNWKSNKVGEIITVKLVSYEIVLIIDAVKGLHKFRFHKNFGFRSYRTGLFPTSKK